MPELLSLLQRFYLDIRDRDAVRVKTQFLSLGRGEKWNALTTQKHQMKRAEILPVLAQKIVDITLA